ncbi:hypothetical protein G5I_03554 [Acromyrmex echinatior]|uniref:Uncharacterized protein n=1 Tax=Acromyrmex echinatior TaxID=103372 RepID=F4WDA1_ACREC|nr:hypothetical protein G5I_03554 [Acromyrmex echinatior]
MDLFRKQACFSWDIERKPLRIRSLIAPTDLYLSSRILLVPTGNSVSKRDEREERKKKEEKKKRRKRLHRDDLSSRASIIFQLLGRTSTRWDSCIPDVIGVGFAAANVTGEIRRPRMALERGIKNGYCPGSDVPSRASEDLEEEWPGRRERRNLTRERDPTKGIDFDLVTSVRNSKPVGGVTPAKRNIDEFGVIGCRLSLLASIAQSDALIKTDNTAARTTRRSSISAEYLRRNPSTINAAITSAIGVIGRVYQPALPFPVNPFLQVSLFLSPPPPRLEVVHLREKFVDWFDHNDCMLDTIERYRRDRNTSRNVGGEGWRARIGLVNKGRPTSSILSRYEPTGFSLVVGSATCPFYDVIYPRKRPLDKVIP